MGTEHRYIDLHMHTTISDGTDTPAEILKRVRDCGIDLFSVTDHDAIKGGIMVPDLLSEGDPAFIRGVEFSCRDADGKYHVLGYGYDPSRKGIRDLVDRGHAMRMAKTAARISYLQDQFGMRFPEKEVRELIALDNPGKPHIALMMVRNGYADSIDEAIHKYINTRKFPDMYLEPETAIRAIRRSGGIPVLAHPVYGSGDELILGEELKQRVQRLMKHGLEGVEGFYSGFTEKMRSQVLDLAEENGLYVTAGSDYHGTNKLVQLGDHELEDAAEAPAGLQRFLKAVPIIRAVPV